MAVTFDPEIESEIESQLVEAIAEERCPACVAGLPSTSRSPRHTNGRRCIFLSAADQRERDERFRERREIAVRFYGEHPYYDTADERDE